MAPTTRKGASSASESTSESSLFVLVHGQKRVLVRRPSEFTRLDELARKSFPGIITKTQQVRLTFHTKELKICQGSWVEVSEDSWKDVAPLLSSLEVRVEAVTEGQCESDCEGSSESDSDSEGPPPKRRKTLDPIASPYPIASPEEPTRVDVIIQDVNWQQVRFKAKSTTTAGKLKKSYARITGKDPKVIDFLFDGMRLKDVDPLGPHESESITIDAIIRQIGGKPVIYVLPRDGEEIRATVHLSLVPEWEFSALYPVVPASRNGDGGQAVKWVVRAASDGTLFEENTKLEVSYLYWEATAMKMQSEPISPPGSPNPLRESPTTAEGFVPNQARLSPHDSVVIQVSKVPHYLDSALRALGLDTEARTSFITYWLPSILKHEYIALRFLPQAAYEQSAPLEVTPPPDVTVRVFMLFEGLGEDEATGVAWAEALGKANADVSFWRGVVGVDDERTLEDKSLFRVIEWGGMEIV